MNDSNEDELQKQKHVDFRNAKNHGDSAITAIVSGSASRHCHRLKETATNTESLQREKGLEGGFGKVQQERLKVGLQREKGLDYVGGFGEVQ